MITENGAAYVDTVVDGRVADTDRIAYLDGHLRAVHDAIERGASTCAAISPGRCWTTSSGRTATTSASASSTSTTRRSSGVPKDSALWFRDVIRRNAV